MNELKAYELKDGAYGMYLSQDGRVADVDLGSLYYSKEQVDKQFKSTEKRFKKAIQRLSELRLKYKKLRAVCVDARRDSEKFVKSLEEFRI